MSRRFLWDFISTTMSGRAVILTTHSYVPFLLFLLVVVMVVAIVVFRLGLFPPFRHISTSSLLWCLYSPFVCLFVFFRMEEAEALSSRIGIMVDGRLQCRWWRTMGR